ncbi:uncharacterized protein PAF06_009440 [Gastrophryne carolinensis]
MSTQTRINGFTAWMNVRLQEVNGHVNNVLLDLFQGTAMKLLLESFTGKPLKRFASLDGLTQQQIITRVERFVEEMKRHEILPESTQVNCKSIALQNKDQVLELLWKIISHDLLFTWERSSQLMHNDDKVACSVPFKLTPLAPAPAKKHAESASVLSLLGSLDAISSKLHRQSFQEQQSIEPAKDETDWVPFPGRELAKSFNKGIPKGGWQNYPSPERCTLRMVNALLKEATKGTADEIRTLKDLVHCSVICTLVNYFLPQTFAVEIILDDRWAVNVALKTFEALFFITTSFSCDDLLQGDLQAVCSYVCFICMAGFKYRQSKSVVNYAKQLSFRIEVAMSELKLFPSEKLELNQFAERNELQQKVKEMRNELQWLKKSYDLERCQKWVKHARKVQRKTKDIIQQKVKDRFEIVAVPRALSIGDLCLTLGINLQLSQGSGFPHVWHKQTVQPDSKMVLLTKDTEKFLEDFSGSQNKVNVHKLLNLPFEATELNPSHYRNYEIFLECKLKNKMLKANSLFLYQVFSGYTSQWLNIFHQAVNENKCHVTENLLSLFKEACPHLINTEEMPSGCIALHLACQNGFLNGSVLPILDLKGLNKFVRLRMESLRSTVMSLKPGDWMSTVDIKKAYLHIPIFLGHQKDKAVFRFKLDFLPKVVSPFHLNEEVVLPSLCPVPHNPKERFLHSLDVDMALLLLENGAAVNKKDGNNHTPFYYALASKHKDVCKLLIEWGYRIRDYNINQPSVSVILRDKLKDFCKGYSDMWQLSVHQALEGNCEYLKKIITDHQNEHNMMASLRSRCIDGSTLLHVATYFGELQSVQSLLQLEVDVNILDYKGATPLQRSRDVETMQLLLLCGAEVDWQDDDGNTALHMVCYGELGKPTRMDCLQLLLLHGASTRKSNKSGLLPIHCAALQGRKDATHTILNLGYKEDLIKEHGIQMSTPSLPYLALANGHVECTKWLISNHQPLKDGEDAELLFDLLCSKDEWENNAESVDFLLSNALNVNICDRQAALQKENDKMMKLLLSYGAQVNIQNHDGITPIFNAVCSSNYHGTRLLIDNGADLKHRDNGGLTAFDYIKNIDEWIECDMFSKEINELLRISPGFNNGPNSSHITLGCKGDV